MRTETSNICKEVWDLEIPRLDDLQPGRRVAQLESPRSPTSILESTT